MICLAIFSTKNISDNIIGLSNRAEILSATTLEVISSCCVAMRITETIQLVRTKSVLKTWFLKCSTYMGSLDLGSSDYCWRYNVFCALMIVSCYRAGRAGCVATFDYFLGLLAVLALVQYLIAATFGRLKSAIILTAIHISRTRPQSSILASR